MISSYAAYHARRWATERTDDEILEEVAAQEQRYLKPYPGDGVESAHHTISRIETPNAILVERSTT